jgi:hypothetical protein
VVHLGLSDGDIMGCVEHGYDKMSGVVVQAPAAAATRRENPVNATFRVAAHMSGVDFVQVRARRDLQQQELQLQLQQQQQQQ